MFKITYDFCGKVLATTIKARTEIEARGMFRRKFYGRILSVTPAQ
jgi:hypothetical protein